ncbi:MAG: 1-aminocyclopropane-1-carboxylate deaminase/D-cysteine desulfhydrase [Candidatus Cyclobacteriaceae bacterium M2_1C_046]
MEIILVTTPESSGIQLHLGRIDKTDPYISGNKWYKLKYNLKKAKDEGYDTILTFGGAYSNHIYSTAAAAQEHGMKSIGLIRGEEKLPLNPTLKFASEHGMELHYVSRSDYRKKGEPDFINALREKFGRFYLIPEGGTNDLAVKGVAEIIHEVYEDYNYWITPVGTGGTLAGLVKGLEGKNNVLGFSALKGAEGGLENDIASLLNHTGNSHLKNWSVKHDYHFGGYAKIDQQLINFILDFQILNNVLLDPIYTSKMMYGVFKLIEAGYFPPGSKILAFHTGGLQGWNGMKERYSLVNNLFPLDGA